MRHCVQELLQLGPVFVIFRIVQLSFGQFDPLHQRIAAQFIDRYGTFRQQSQSFRCDISKATKNDIFAGFPEANFTVTTPGLITVIVGAWWAMTVISPSVAGMTTSLTFSEISNRSGETNSKLKLSAMAFYFLTLETERTVINRAFFDPWIRQQQLPTSLPFRWLRPLSRPCRRRLPAYGRSRH